MGQEDIQRGMPAHPHGEGVRRSRPAEDRPIDLRKPDDGISTLIPYTNPKALIAYYCGVFALIPCAGLALGPAALVLGILGLQYVRANPTAKGTAHAIVGIVLGSFTTLGNLTALIWLVVLYFMNVR